MNPTHALLELLLPSLVAAASPRTADVSRTVEIEIVETADARDGKRKRAITRLELPANGKLETWIGDDTRARVCQVESRTTAGRSEMAIELRCQTGGRDALEVEAEPVLIAGKRTTLAKIDRPDGGSTTVTAALR